MNNHQILKRILKCSCFFLFSFLSSICVCSSYCLSSLCSNLWLDDFYSKLVQHNSFFSFVCLGFINIFKLKLIPINIFVFTFWAETMEQTWNCIRPPRHNDAKLSEFTKVQWRLIIEITCLLVPTKYHQRQAPVESETRPESRERSTKVVSSKSER